MRQGISRRSLVTGASAVTAGVLLGATGGAAAASADLISIPVAKLSGLWLPSTVNQQLRVGNFSEFLASTNSMFSQGYRLKTLTSYISNNEVEYFAAFNAGSHSQHLGLDRDLNQLLSEYNTQWGLNRRLAHLNVYIQNGVPRYNAIYNASTASQGLRLARTFNDFLTTYSDMWNQGFRIAGLVTYNLNGTVYYGGFFKPSTSGQFLALDRTGADFLNESQQQFNAGWKLAAYSTYLRNGTVYYNAAYNPGSGGQYIHIQQDGLADRGGLPGEPPAGVDIRSQFQTTYNTMSNAGFRLAIVATDSLLGGNSTDWPV